MTFSGFAGHEDAKTALILNAVDPNCGGVLLVGEKGSGKSTLSRLFRNLLPEQTPFVEIPLNITEDALLGGIDLEETIKTGRKAFQKGILGYADGGIIYIDDLHLLAPGIMALVLEARCRGENIIEREGLRLRHPARFIIVASMNSEEGPLSSHVLDRFGMSVHMESIKDHATRMDIIKKAVPSIFPADKYDDGADRKLVVKIKYARSILCEVTSPAEIKEYISHICRESRISGHRGDIHLFYAARAYTAFSGEMVVRKEHVDRVVPFVLAHRKRLIQQTEREETEYPQGQQDEDARHDEKTHNKNRPANRPAEQDNKRLSTDEDTGESHDSDTRAVETVAGETVFEVGNTFRVRRLAFKKDRLKRKARGRRTRTTSAGRGGSYVKSIMRPEGGDMAIDATIRAAAPFQKTRGRKDMLVILEEDLRFKQREKRMGHLVVFVVDGSGSMGANKRMTETKGAIQSLLMDCYQKRDRVSMIVFRKDRAEVVLPPTSSVALASKKLREIKVGGRTPLGAGLSEAYRLIKQVTVKEPETRFLLVIITDGRANQSITGASAGKEVEKMTELLLELRHTDYIVVDTEDKGSFIKTDIALNIASQLGAHYYLTPELKSEYLSEMVQFQRKP